MTDDTDPRFTFGLLSDICEVLHKHGYHPPADKQANNLALGRTFEGLFRLVRDFEGVTIDEPAPHSEQSRSGNAR